MRAELQLRKLVDERGEERYPARRKGMIESAGSYHVPGVITDLSCSGFRIVVDEPVEPDSVVWLELGGHGPFMARVVWYDGAAAGCAFSSRLRADLVADLLRS